MVGVVLVILGGFQLMISFLLGSFFLVFDPYQGGSEEILCSTNGPPVQELWFLAFNMETIPQRFHAPQRLWSGQLEFIMRIGFCAGLLDFSRDVLEFDSQQGSHANRMHFKPTMERNIVQRNTAESGEPKCFRHQDDRSYAAKCKSLKINTSAIVILMKNFS